ncbi:uncharacterized protein LOC134240748 [Saccostrea cucullata]|uniref:uncharacterized protein LOC134240748 n=1 Tax=Saccostrea cuccullata TaxID=36930 RepID=UPI002ED3BF4B
MSELNVRPLLTLLEAMIDLATPKVNVKPGGYSEDIFINLTPEQKEEFECSICYQILKEPRRCSNSHKYCYSCIFVWSTSGPHLNHRKCPVCRTEGYYIRDRELEEKVGNLKVKCHLESCKWKGPLKLLARHTHTTYTRTGLPFRSRFDDHYRSMYSEIAEPEDDLPRLNNGSHESGTRLSLRPPSTANRLTRSRLSGTQTAREAANTAMSASPQQSVSAINTPRTPHPPTTPRPAGQTVRRVPTLPSIINGTNNSMQHGRATQAHETRSQQQRSTATNEHRPQPPQQPRTTTRGARANPSNPGFSNVRDRLRESRERLDNLMSAFSNELERGRRGLTEFQETRERRRQEQLEEVRELGRRLNYVATELRGLLEQRRQLRDDLEEISDEYADS